MSTNIIIPEEKVQKIDNFAAEMLGKAEFAVIEDDAAFQSAQKWLTSTVAAHKKVKSFIKELVQPHKDAVKATEGKLKPLLKPYEEAEGIWRTKCNAYLAKKRAEEEKKAAEEKKKREAEELKNKKRMNELLALGFVWNKEEEHFELGEIRVRPVEIKSDNEATWTAKFEGWAKEASYAKPKKEEAKKKAEPEELPELAPDPEPVEKEELAVKSDAGTTYTQKRWTYKEVDLSKVPREYLKLDSKAVNAAIKAGTHKIPGLEIFEEETLAVRTK